jgi:hypothetical protein
VPAGTDGQALGIGNRVTGVQGDAIEVALGRAVARCHDVGQAASLVHVRQPGHRPFSRRQRPRLLAVRPPDLDVPEAARFGRAQDAAVREYSRVAVLIDPWIAVLRPQATQLATGGQPAPPQLALVARHCRQQPTAGGVRDDPGQVLVVRLGERHIHRRAALARRHDPQRDPGVRAAGERVAVLLLRDVVAHRMRNHQGSNFSLIDVGEREVRTIPAPPHALEAVELLGGCILGQAVRDPVLRVGGDPTRFGVAALDGQPCDPQVAFADVRDPSPVR